ncbi:Clavaminate synthase-like protein [Tothia fuscella]|uniref:Clavaminate synthase-like protein n=1 Tax=Tothia fuscella TaxID=1048955 RepID=A0A9P4NMF4_9PEZI|nr:Clavaminate synthase-like protein [Tothia fuscella]
MFTRSLRLPSPGFIRSRGGALGVGRGKVWTRRYSNALYGEQQEADQPSSPLDEAIKIPAAKLENENLHLDTPRKPSFHQQVEVELDGKTATFDSIFLRDSCKCPVCVNPSSTQKTFQTADIPASIEGSCQVTSELDEMDLALINWKNDISGYPEGHQTALPLDFLRESLRLENNHQTRQHIIPQRAFWESKMMNRDIAFLDYDSYMKSEKTLYQALKLIYTHGLVFIKNVPDTTAGDNAQSVTSVVERIGSLRETFYGRTWDVKSVPNAKNVAYTNVYLGLHMDLCYMDNTPHLQFLHSMRARAPGGESMFSDSFYAAEKMRQEAPELFEALRTFDVTYHYFNDGMAYRQIRPTVELVDMGDPTSPIKLINWSPPFQGPFTHDIGTKDGGKALKVYHAAAQMFDQLTNDTANMYEYRMNEGDCVIFDNRRVLHARRAFEAAKGERWLKGAYMDRDVYASKLAVLGEMYGEEGKSQ